MRLLALAAAAIVALAAAVAATAPASLAGAAVERATGGAATVAGADGTLWRGRGTLAAGSALRLPVAWSINPLPLARGELRLQILPGTSTGDAPRADVSARDGAIALRALEVALPADGLAALAPRSGLRIAGDVRVSAASLERSGGAWNGGARIAWEGARLAVGSEPPLRLGTVRAELAAAGDRLAGPVTNEGGEFDVRGTLSIDAAGAPDVALTLTPRGGGTSQARALAIVATRGAAGWSVDLRTDPR
jgi:hypothetical protein